MTARVILHLPDRYQATFRSKKHLIYNKIEEILLPKGGQVVLRGRPRALPPVADDDLHILDNGQARQPGWLNAATAYFEAFWHLDPIGVLAESAIGHMPYDPTQVDPGAAAAFFARLHARFAGARHSRYRQPGKVALVPQGAIAVFLQGPAPHLLGQAYCSVAAMLAAVAKGAQGRAVLVKPHPLQRALGQSQIAAARAEGHALTATDANVHDILARAAVSVSINSAVALEGFQHGVPAVVFGKSDFHHFVRTVRDPADFPAALTAALASTHDYARALYWYFDRNCLWLDAPDFDQRLLAVFAKAGFDAARLGLRP